ncbi:nucleoside diphosphate kinase regulator [Alloalcanivorax mobilis]|uniref:nucleoside diphosphate kinase regulator n=1 Tax=Alloalcanivorax mobilis TaxID=2019569 RepID=UPI000C772E07|nr:nucleoside diphosphate kinase regulator [Alloalcanivorax mobilis]
MLPPPITVSSLDVSRLEPLLEKLADDASADLEEELLRATVVAPAAVPANVVTMNSRVRCREQSSGREWAVTLVYPRDIGRPDCVSVLAPVGAALLGLSVGQSIDWPGPNGRTLRLSILEIEYQPEAAGDFDL